MTFIERQMYTQEEIGRTQTVERFLFLEVLWQYMKLILRIKSNGWALVLIREFR